VEASYSIISAYPTHLKQGIPEISEFLKGLAWKVEKSDDTSPTSCERCCCKFNSRSACWNVEN